MVILQDSREQFPLVFDHPFVEDIEITKLDVGDYGVRFKDGHTPSVFFERKSLGDLFSTLGVGYKRFKREILRAQESDSTLILIVEASLSKVFKGTKYSSIEGSSMVKKMFTLWIRHGIMPVFCKNPEEVSEYITHTFLALGREHIRRKK